MREAAVIAIPHQKWTERPLLVVVPAAKSSLSRDAMLDFLQVRPVTAVQLFKANTRHCNMPLHKVAKFWAMLQWPHP